MDGDIAALQHQLETVRFQQESQIELISELLLDDGQASNMLPQAQKIAHKKGLLNSACHLPGFVVFSFWYLPLLNNNPSRCTGSYRKK